MSNKKTRGVFAALAAGALALSMAPNALATLDDADGAPVVIVPDEKVSNAEVFRIADSTRILTAIEASESRTDWGRIYKEADATGLFWSCSNDDYPLHDDVAGPGWEEGEFFFPVYVGKPILGNVKCTVVKKVTEVGATYGNMDIIVARSDDYPDALAAAPLADVLDAPILLHPTTAPAGSDANGNGVMDSVEAEIERLAKVGAHEGVSVTVHLLGGTQALAHSVENGIDGIKNVDNTLRYQGLNRYETASNIAKVTVDAYGLESGAKSRDVNVYLTTGENFPDALAAGAAASNNDGVVLLTQGTKLDTYEFTLDFLKRLRNWVDDTNNHINTSEIFAVGGPSATAAAGSIDLAASYVGVNRYETATLTAEATFGNPRNYAVVSGETFPDAL
ncbi:MAG: cell wall-binding repeat-containing protein, partial [Propionibacterium sp.]|nr:cell wall-binding repeat-containing protein [Propionibacterium sp.]